VRFLQALLFLERPSRFGRELVRGGQRGFFGRPTAQLVHAHEARALRRELVVEG
jgi:hypothetical protein